MTKSNQKKTQDQKIMGVLKQIQFYKTPDEAIYASPNKNYPYKVTTSVSAAFMGRVRKEYYNKHGIILKDKAIEQALTIVAYDEKWHKNIDKIFSRFGYCGEDLYIDLQEKSNNRIVKITPSGWTIGCDCPIFFETFPGQKEIAPPVHSGSFDAIKYFLKSEHVERRGYSFDGPRKIIVFCLFL